MKISTIHTKFSLINTYTMLIGGYITKFTYVKGLVKSLAARGDTTMYLLTNLFKGYLAVEDKTFHAYIESK